MDKLSTFAPALLERQSLMIDILLMIKGSENKNKKTMLIHKVDNNRFWHSTTTSPYWDSSFQKEENGNTTDY